MSKKFEQLLDYLVNEEMDKANELFHEIVVEKSRDIYENLISEEEADEAKKHEDESVEEEADEENESVEEDADEAEESVEEDADEAEESVEEAEEYEEEGMAMDLEDSYEVEGDDEVDSMPGDDDKEELPVGSDDLSNDEEEAVAMDIKAAIDQLEQAFAKLGGDMDLEPEMDKDMGGDKADKFGVDAGMGDMGDEKPKDEDYMGFSESRRVTREYVEKVGNDWEKNSQKTQGAIVGKNTGESMPTAENNKGPVSSGKGKPTTGATPGNIAKGGEEGGSNTGTSPAKVNKGINPESGEKFAKGLHNVDGAKSGVKTLSKVAHGHGAEKKGAGPGPVGAGTGDKAGQTSVDPMTKKQFLPSHK